MNGDQNLSFLFVLVVGLAAGTISGIVGTGSTIMLMPVLVYQYGPKQAVPIMAVAAVMSNLSRILAWWREVDWRACAGLFGHRHSGGRARRAHAPGAAVACRRHLDRAVFDRDGAGAALARPPRDQAVALASCDRRRRDRLPHRRRGFDRPAERAAVSVLRPRQGRVPRHRSGKLARALHQQIGDVPALRRADAGCRAARA